MRRTLSTKLRVQIFRDANGCCDICGGKINVGERWEVSHRIPLALGGEDAIGNMFPAHAKCHRSHTSEIDQPAIARAKRRESRNLGAHRSANPLPFGKTSKWKRKLNGQIVPR